MCDRIDFLLQEAFSTHLTPTDWVKLEAELSPILQKLETQTRGRVAQQLGLLKAKMPVDLRQFNLVRAIIWEACKDEGKGKKKGKPWDQDDEWDDYCKIIVSLIELAYRISLTPEQWQDLIRLMDPFMERLQASSIDVLQRLKDRGPNSITEQEYNMMHRDVWETCLRNPDPDKGKKKKTEEEQLVLGDSCQWLPQMLAKYIQSPVVAGGSDRNMIEQGLQQLEARNPGRSSELEGWRVSLGSSASSRQDFWRTLHQLVTQICSVGTQPTAPQPAAPAPQRPTAQRPTGQPHIDLGGTQLPGSSVVQPTTTTQEELQVGTAEQKQGIEGGYDAGVQQSEALSGQISAGIEEQDVLANPAFQKLAADYGSAIQEQLEAQQRREETAQLAGDIAAVQGHRQEEFGDEKEAAEQAAEQAGQDPKTVAIGAQVAGLSGGLQQHLQKTEELLQRERADTLDSVSSVESLQTGVRRVLDQPKTTVHYSDRPTKDQALEFIRSETPKEEASWVTIQLFVMEEKLLGKGNQEIASILSGIAGVQITAEQLNSKLTESKANLPGFKAATADVGISANIQIAKLREQDILDKLRQGEDSILRIELAETQKMLKGYGQQTLPVPQSSVPVQQDYAEHVRAHQQVANERTEALQRSTELLSASTDLKQQLSNHGPMLKSAMNNLWSASKARKALLKHKESLDLASKNISQPSAGLIRRHASVIKEVNTATAGIHNKKGLVSSLRVAGESIAQQLLDNSILQRKHEANVDTIESRYNESSKNLKTKAEFEISRKRKHFPFRRMEGLPPARRWKEAEPESEEEEPQTPAQLGRAARRKRRKKPEPQKGILEMSFDEELAKMYAEEEREGGPWHHRVKLEIPKDIEPPPKTPEVDMRKLLSTEDFPTYVTDPRFKVWDPKKVPTFMKMLEDRGQPLEEDVDIGSRSHTQWKQRGKKLKARMHSLQKTINTDITKHTEFRKTMLTLSPKQANEIVNIATRTSHHKQITKENAQAIWDLIAPSIKKRFPEIARQRFTAKRHKIGMILPDTLDAVATFLRENANKPQKLNPEMVMVLLDVTGDRETVKRYRRAKGLAMDKYDSLKKEMQDTLLDYKHARIGWQATDPTKIHSKVKAAQRRPKQPRAKKETPRPWMKTKETQAKARAKPTKRVDETPMPWQATPEARKRARRKEPSVSRTWTGRASPALGQSGVHYGRVGDIVEEAALPPIRKRRALPGHRGFTRVSHTPPRREVSKNPPRGLPDVASNPGPYRR